MTKPLHIKHNKLDILIAIIIFLLNVIYKKDYILLGWKRWGDIFFEIYFITKIIRV